MAACISAAATSPAMAPRPVFATGRAAAATARPTPQNEPLVGTAAAMSARQQIVLLAIQQPSCRFAHPAAGSAWPVALSSAGCSGAIREANSAAREWTPTPEKRRTPSGWAVLRQAKGGFQEANEASSAIGRYQLTIRPT